MKFNKKLVAPALGLACCMAIGVGTTYALFTSQDEVNIAVTSGKVAVKASVGGLELYSPKGISTEEGHAITDDTNIAANGTFGNGGTAVVENGTLKLDKLTPGDKVSAKLTVKNESNVAAKYRVSISAGDEASSALLSGMKVGFDYDLDGEVNDLESIKSITTAWATLPTEDTEYAISFELPTTAGNVYQGLSAALAFSVEAVQGNAAVTGDLVIEKIIAKAEKVENTPTATPGVYNVPAAAMVADSGSTEVMGAVSFTAEEGWATTAAAESTVIFSAVTNDAETANSSATFEVAEGLNIAGSLDLSMVVDGEAVTEFEVPVTIRTNIGTGLAANKVAVFYGGVDLKQDDNPVTDYSYDPIGGLLAITTNHFSEYFIVTPEKSESGAEAPALVDPLEGKTATVTVTNQAEYKAAVEAATNDSVIGLKAGTYKFVASATNHAILGLEEGVEFDCKAGGQIAQYANGVTMKNVTLNWNASGTNYTGFQHSNGIVMYGCTINGLFFSYGNMDFRACTFNQTAGEYHMWVYAGNISYNACTFNGKGKFLNVYNEGNSTTGPWELNVYNTNFVSSAANKSALNIKAGCVNSKQLAYVVNAIGCTTEGAFPANADTGTLYRTCALWQVDDIPSTINGEGYIEVNVDGEQVYKLAKAA